MSDGELNGERVRNKWVHNGSSIGQPGGDRKGRSISADEANRARAYFSRPGFKRILEAVWKRYVSLEKAGGHAVIRNASAEECEEVNAFFGWYKKPGDSIRIPLEKFEQELLGSAFPFTIAELHKTLTGKLLRTKSGRKLLALQDWQALFEALTEQLKMEGKLLQPEVTDWLDGLRAGRALGYRTLRELWRVSPELAKRELTHAARAWNLLLAGIDLVGLDEDGTTQSSIRLPILAALATGDPHALDRNVPAGRLLFQALRSVERGKPFGDVDKEDQVYAIDPTSSSSPTNSEIILGLSSGVDSLEAREIYRRAGIMDDDISSLVHIYCPWGSSISSYVLTLRQVEKTSELPPVTDLYVVENPAVFSTLVDLTEVTLLTEKTELTGKMQFSEGTGVAGNTEREFLKSSGPLLLCTSGPASAAALRLIDRYLEEGLVSGRLYYSGDFDVKGIAIGNVLALRYGARFTAWGFDRDSYLEGGAFAFPNGVAFSPEEQHRLLRMQAAWDNSLCKTMGDTGRKLFQEQIIVRLAEDWNNAVKGGAISC